MRNIRSRVWWSRLSPPPWPCAQPLRPVRRLTRSPARRPTPTGARHSACTTDPTRRTPNVEPASRRPSPRSCVEKRRRSPRAGASPSRSRRASGRSTACSPATTSSPSSSSSATRRTRASRPHRPGPQHNEIPEPDRSVDNTHVLDRRTSTAQHFLDMFFGDDGESMKNVYEELSSGRYTVDGDVTDWVKVPVQRGELRRDREPDRHDVASSRTAPNAWYAQQKAAGKSDADIKAYLATFDQWDRYDYDKDGDFKEPDGYIDHYQAVHAGEDESAGAPELGDLGPPLGRQPGRQRQPTDRSTQVRRHPDRQHRHVDPRLHHRAGERRSRRVRPRVRPRPRSAGPLRHRWRRERHRLLDADELGLVAGPRERHHRHDARTTWAPGRSCSSAGSTTTTATAGTTSTHMLGPSIPRHQEAAGPHRRAAQGRQRQGAATTSPRTGSTSATTRRCRRGRTTSAGR